MGVAEELLVVTTKEDWGKPARRGTVPRLGEVWEPVGPTMTLLTAHLVRVRDVAPFVPPGLVIQPVLPGYTVASTLLSYYGPESTLEYNELVVAGALVRHRGRVAPFVTHIYVDSERSVTGGRRMGLPKELATFDWNGRAPSTARVTRVDGVPVATIAYGRRGTGLTLRLAGPTISVIGREVWRFTSWMRGAWGLTRASVEAPPTSPVAPLQLGRALVALSCGPMRGRMGESMRTIGTLPALPGRAIPDQPDWRARP